MKRDYKTLCGLLRLHVKIINQKLVKWMPYSETSGNQYNNYSNDENHF